MLNVAVLLFAIAALGGLTLAVLHFRGADRPWGLALLHGGVAATALVLLALPVFAGTAPAWAGAALALFVLAALGGFYLFAHHLKKQPLPSTAVVIHGGAAVVAFVILLVAVYLRG